MTNPDGMIFVFGSNLAGRHGAGAARVACKKYGAKYGVGEGLTNSAYALPTKDASLKTMPIEDVEDAINRFLEYAYRWPDLKFKVTQIGCGLAGFHAAQVAPMFKNAPENCFFDEEWRSYLGDSVNYWGTFK